MKTSIFTLYYSIECYSTNNLTKPLVWVSSIDPSNDFDNFSYAYIYQPQLEYVVAESPLW